MVCVCSKVVPGHLGVPDDHAWIGDGAGVGDGSDPDASLISLGTRVGELDLEAAAGEDVEEVELAHASSAQVGAVGLVGDADHAIDEDLPEAGDVVLGERRGAVDARCGQGVMRLPTLGWRCVKMTILTQL